MPGYRPCQAGSSRLRCHCASRSRHQMARSIYVQLTLIRRNDLSAAEVALSQLSECLVGVRDGLGVDVAGGSPVGDFLPVGPGEYPLDREYLGGPQSCLDARAEGAR